MEEDQIKLRTLDKVYLVIHSQVHDLGLQSLALELAMSKRLVEEAEMTQLAADDLARYLHLRFHSMMRKLHKVVGL